MKKNIKLVRIIIAAVVFIAGLVLGINGYTKRMSDSYAALKEAGTNGSVDMLYAIGLVLVIIGIVIFIAAVTAPKEPKNVPIIVLAEAALLAALCYVGAGYLKIDIPVGTEKTMFHLGNVFCVLAALLLGGMEGTEKVDNTVYIWYNVSIKYRRCFYDRTTAEIGAKSIHGNI